MADYTDRNGGGGGKSIGGGKSAEDALKALKDNPLPHLLIVCPIVTHNKPDQFNARLEYAIYLQNKYHMTYDQSWNRKSNDQLNTILNLANSRKAEAYFQLAANNQSLLSYTADDLTDEEYDNLLDTVVIYYQKSLEASRVENNIKVYNEIFDRLATACPYFPEDKCSELLIEANEVKGYFLQKNKSINEEITKRNEQFASENLLTS